MKRSEFREHHEREAARLRSLAANATTAALKARLLDEADKHDQLAEWGVGAQAAEAPANHPH
jgi:hypothetical protein